MIKRDLFIELEECFAALADERTRKATLRKHDVEYEPPVELPAPEVVRACTKPDVS